MTVGVTGLQRLQASFPSICVYRSRRGMCSFMPLQLEQEQKVVELCEVEFRSVLNWFGWCSVMFAAFRNKCDLRGESDSAVIARTDRNTLGCATGEACCTDSDSHVTRAPARPPSPLGQLFFVGISGCRCCRGCCGCRERCWQHHP